MVLKELGKVGKIYLANNFTQEPTIKNPLYFVRDDGVRLDHHLVSCILAMFEASKRKVIAENEDLIL
jgi:hypothetical protein